MESMNMEDLFLEFESEHETTETASNQFVIDNDQKAEWAMRKIRETKQETNRLVSLCQDQIAFYKNKLDKITQDGASRIGNLEYMLRTYFDASEHLHSISKSGRHTYKLASGKMVLKPQQPEYKHDDAILLGWLKENGLNDYVQIKEAPKWADIKKSCTVCDGQIVFSDTGEIVPGVSVENRDPVFVVEVE